MSEMLANQYFLVRNFLSAKTLYEKILEKDPINKSIRKKLTICYITTGEIDKALNVFSSLIKEDVDFVINTDVNSEDCPCPELISQIENEEKLFESSIDKLTALGMLWLYCNPVEAFNYFRKVSDSIPDDERYSQILKIISNKIIKSSIH